MKKMMTLWVRAWRGFLGLESWGSQYEVNIGSGARSVAVGANILQIGNLTLPTFPFLLIAGMVAAYMGWQVWQQRGPTEMTGEFNIAIAEFGRLDENGRVQSTDLGKDISGWLYERVNQEYGALASDLVVEVWHNKMNLGVNLGPVPGSTMAARAEAAAELAEQINAHVLVYGNLAETEMGLQFVPEFYVRELPDAGELIGPHQLGQPIPMPEAQHSLVQTLQFNPRLSDRTKALALFTIGLAWEFAGTPEGALATFREAEDLSAWRDEEGREILYLFIGREAFLLWRAGQDREEEVYMAFTTALRLNPQYGRAYIGLGNFYREKAERRLPQIYALKAGAGPGDPALLAAVAAFDQETAQAIAVFKQAIDNDEEMAAGQVAVKGNIGLAGMYLMQGYVAEIQQQYGLAQQEYARALAGYEQALSLAEADDARHRALAQLGMADVKWALAQLRLRRTDVPPDDETTQALLAEAQTAVQACLAYADQDKADWFLQDMKMSHCLPLQARINDVLEGE